MSKRVLSLLIACAAAVSLCAPVAASFGAGPTNNLSTENSVKSIRMSKNSLELVVGETWDLFVKFSPSDTSDNISWRSDNSDIVSVDDDGSLVANKVGTTYITAKSDGGLTTACRVDVASAGGETRPRSFEMSMASMTVRLNQTRQLAAYFVPSDVSNQSVYWSSSNNDVASVDQDGTVSSVAPGTAIITAENAYGETTTCEITVPGSGTTASTDVANPKASGDTQLPSGESLSLSAVETVVIQTALTTTKGLVGVATFENKGAISPSAISAAASAAEKNGRDILLQFNTTDEIGKVHGMLVIDPKKAGTVSSEIQTGVYLNTKQSKAIETVFGKYFANKVAVIQTAHSGSYGMEVEVAARVDLTGMNKDGLYFYVYDVGANRYDAIPASSYSTATSLLRFKTTAGGYIIVSDGPLAKK